MARAVRLDTLRTRLEQRADIVNDQSFGTTEKTSILNEALAGLYDELVAAAPPHFYLTETTIAVTSGTTAYNLPADFYKAAQVAVDEGSNRRRPLFPLDPSQIGVLRGPLASATVYLRYLPACPLLANDGDTFDGVNGWEELAVVDAAIRVYFKKGLNTGPLMAEREYLLARIRKMSNRDVGSPRMVQRVSQRNSMWPTNTALAYYGFLGAAQIEFYQSNTPLWGWP